MLLIAKSGIGIKSRTGITTTLALVMLALLPSVALATTLTSTAVSSAEEDPFSALLTIDDAITPGSIVLSIAVEGDASKIKIRGFASGVADGTLLSGATVVGDDVKRSFFNLGDDTLGKHKIDPDCTTCDMVVTFNKPLKGDLDRSVSFTLSDSAGPIGLSTLQGQDFAILLQMKGGQNVKGKPYGFFFHDHKWVILEGSTTASPIPEPSTAFLLVLGLGGLSLGARRKPTLRG